MSEKNNARGDPKTRALQFSIESRSWRREFWDRIKDFSTERRVRITHAAPVDIFNTGQFGAGFWENLKNLFAPTPKGNADSVFLVPWRSWYVVMWENLRDFVKPRRLPPLRTTSQPVKVKEIWSKNKMFPRTQLVSLAVHALLVAFVLSPLIYNATKKTEAKKTTITETTNISPYWSQLPPGKDKAGGGGGGGERMNTPPTKGKLPKWSMTQFAKPMAVPRNENPRLAMEPTLLGPPDLKVPSPNLPNYGDPLQKLLTGSGGPGGGGGIGTGEGGGIGSGTGGGLGPGSGGGTGGGVFRAGTGGVGYPSCAYCPNPQYSEEARKAKYQGTVVLQVVITTDGRAINIKIIKGPGLGLEDRAVEAVKTWRFAPALGPDGKPVAVLVPVEVNFRLL